MKDMYALNKSQNYRDTIGLSGSLIRKIKETEDGCCKLFMHWIMSEIDNVVTFDNDEYHAESFIYQVLNKKLSVFNIDIDVPDYLYMIIDLCVDSNPLKCQMILHNIIMHVDNQTAGYVITTEDFIKTYDNLFPIMDYPKLDEEYHRIANAFKQNENYFYDCREFWNKADYEYIISGKILNQDSKN